MTYRGHIRNGQVTLDEPALLPEGAAVTVEVLKERIDTVDGQPSRQDLLRMPLEKRRKVLSQQAEAFVEHYEAGPDRSDWQGGDIVEE